MGVRKRLRCGVYSLEGTAEEERSGLLREGRKGCQKQTKVQRLRSATHQEHDKKQREKRGYRKGNVRA